MKIIDPGKPWWVGIQARCAECNCAMELQLEDRPTPSYDGMMIDSVLCPTCRAPVKLLRPICSPHTG